MTELKSVRVRVPSSTSNLGSGFDTLGLALSRYLHGSFEPGEGGLELIREGTLARVDVEPHDDFAYKAFRQVMETAEVETGGTLTLRSEIPVARGLGSSAAAYLAGHVLAELTLGLELDRSEAFHAAYNSEGHGDNAAPCTFGGLQAVVQTMDGVRVLPMPLHAGVGFAYAAPTAGVPTQSAREALPKLVDHSVAAAALGRITALLRGLAEADPELVRVGVHDELHVPHRLPLIPGAYNAIGAGYDAGAWGVTISGSGSGLLAICAPEDAPSIASAMYDVFCTGCEDPECVGLGMEPDRTGLTEE